ncbi:MAG: UrcA family protein [Woeseiaceae bacterium]
MKQARIEISLVSAIIIAALSVPGIAIADDVVVTEPASDVQENIVALGDQVELNGESVIVPVADLNLNNEHGVLVLYQRLQNASETVCDVRIAREQKCLQAQLLADDCYRKALSAAVKTVNSEILTKLHQS